MSQHTMGWEDMSQNNTEVFEPASYTGHVDQYIHQFRFPNIECASPDGIIGRHLYLTQAGLTKSSSPTHLLLDLTFNIGGDPV